MKMLRQTGEPFYLQIADRLRSVAQSLPAGERLPSEPQLAKEFGVSRFTVAKAVEMLVKDGLIHRRQGSGTYVAEPPLRRQPGYLLSFTEAVTAAGHSTTHRVLAFRPIGWSADLPYAPDTSLLLFDRLRFVDGVAVARHRSVIEASLAARIGLTETVVSEPGFSLYGHFEAHGLTVATANERLVARLPTPEERLLLELAPESVVVSVSRATYAADGAPLDAVDAIYDARHYSYESRLMRRPDLQQIIMREQKDDRIEGSIDDNPGPRLGPWGDGGAGG